MSVDAIAPDEAETGLVLTPEADLWPVLDGVLTHLDNTVAKETPAESRVRLRLEMLDRWDEAGKSLNRSSHDLRRVRAGLADYQQAVNQTLQAARQIAYYRGRVNDQNASQSDRTRAQAKLAESEGDYEVSRQWAIQAEQAHRSLATAYLTHAASAGIPSLVDDRRQAVLGQAIGDQLPADPSRLAINSLATTTAAAFASTDEALTSVDTGLAAQPDKVALQRAELQKEKAQLKKRAKSSRSELSSTIQSLRQQKNGTQLFAAGYQELSKRQATLDAEWEKKGPPDGDPEPTLTQEQRKLKERRRQNQRKLREAEEGLVSYKRQTLHHLAKVKSLIPRDAAQYVLVDQLETAARAAMLEQDHEHVKKQLAVQANRLRVPGSAISRDIQIELGASYGITDALSVSATYVQGLKWTVKHAGNQYRASFEHSESVKAKGQLGFDLANETEAKASAQVKGGAVFSKTRVYFSLDELVANEAAVMFMAAPLAKTPGKKKDAKPSVSDSKTSTFLQQRRQLLAASHENQYELQRRLLAVGALKQGQRLRPNAPTLPDGFTTESSAVDLSGGGGVSVAVTDNLGVRFGGSLSYKAVTSRSYAVFSYLDDVTENPVLQKLYTTRNPKYLSLVSNEQGQNQLVPGEAAAFLLSTIEKDLDGFDADLDRLAKERATLNSKLDTALDPEKQQLQTRITAIDAERERAAELKAGRRLELKRHLDYLRVEYNSYVHLANQVENGQIKAKSTADVRRAVQQARGADGGDAGAAEYVKAVSLQYAYLRRLYEKSVPGGALPDAERAEFDAFAADLRVPRIAMSDDSFRKALGLSAETPVKKVTTYGGSFTFSFRPGGAVGSMNVLQPATGDDGNIEWSKRDKDGKLVKQDIRPTLNTTVQCMVTTTDDAETQGIPMVFTDAENVRLSGTSATIRFAFSGGVEADNFVANLLTGKDIKRIFSQDPIKPGNDPVDLGPAVDEIKRAMVAVARPGNTVELKLHRRLGQWRLVAALGSETTNRKVGAKVSVPTPVVGLSVVGAFNTAKKSKVVQRQYFAASTLIAVTNVYRARHSADKPDDHAKWDAFCKHSKLMERLVASIESEEAATVESSTSFRELVTSIKQRTLLAQSLTRDELITTKGFLGVTKTSGVLNDTAEWLVDLSASDDAADRAAAASFIRAYELPADSDDKKKTRAAAMAASFKTMVARKTRLENTSAVFRKNRPLTSTDVNAYVADQLAEHAGELDRLLPAEAAQDQPVALKDEHLDVGDDQVQSLKRRAIRNYAAKKDDESFELLKRAYALEYVTETFADLTEFDDPADREQAITLLGADVTKLLKEPRVYLGDRMYGELDLSVKTVRVQPTIKAGMLPLVTSSALDTELARVTQELKRHGIQRARPGASVWAAVKHGADQEVKELTDKYDTSKQAAYEKQLKQKAARRYGDDLGSWYASTSMQSRWVARHLHGARRRNKEQSISELLRKVMEERTKRLQRQQQQRKLRARQAAVAAD